MESGAQFVMSHGQEPGSLMAEQRHQRGQGFLSEWEKAPNLDHAVWKERLEHSFDKKNTSIIELCQGGEICMYASLILDEELIIMTFIDKKKTEFKTSVWIKNSNGALKKELYLYKRNAMKLSRNKEMASNEQYY